MVGRNSFTIYSLGQSGGESCGRNHTLHVGWQHKRGKVSYNPFEVFSSLGNGTEYKFLYKCGNHIKRKKKSKKEHLVLSKQTQKERNEMDEEIKQRIAQGSKQKKE